MKSNIDLALGGLEEHIAQLRAMLDADDPLDVPAFHRRMIEIVQLMAILKSIVEIDEELRLQVQFREEEP